MDSATKTEWLRLKSRVPAGVDFTLYFKEHYSFKTATKSLGDWEYAGSDWDVSMERSKVYGGGKGKTPDEAFDAALADLYSREQQVDQRELSEFKSWRAARERAGLNKPFDRED